MLAIQYLLIFLMVYLITLKFLNFEKHRSVIWFNIIIFFLLSITDIIRQLHYGYQPTKNYDFVLVFSPLIFTIIYMLDAFKSLRAWVTVFVSLFIILFLGNVATSFAFELMGLEFANLSFYGLYNAISAVATLAIFLLMLFVVTLLKWNIDIYALGVVDVILIVIFLYASGFFISAMRARELILIMKILTLIGGTLGVYFVVYVLAQISVLKEAKRREKEQIKLFDEQEKSYQRIQEKTKATVEFKHGIDNELMMIEGYLRDGEFENARAYVEKMQGESKKINNIIGQDTGSRITNTKWYDLINDERYEGVNTTWKGKLPPLISADIREMVLLFHNLLDNAFEAAAKSVGEKFVHVEVNKNETGFSMKIKNSYSGDIKQTANGGFVTSKADKGNHGFGMKIIKRITEKYDGIVDFSFSESEFISFITFDGVVLSEIQE